MSTLLRFAVGGLAAVGFVATASAQYPGHGHPHHTPTVVVVETPVIVQPQIPVYCFDTFARDFRPCPGRHHIAIIHPVTKCPVEVCFTLPDRKLKEVEVHRREIEFKFGLGCHKVELEFKRDGTVRVND